LNSNLLTETTKYIHLNGSFSNHIGLLNGKSSTALYFATLNNPYYQENICISFLEEIFSQIHKETPLTFGTGIAGIGNLLFYLNEKEILKESPEELLADVEPLLIDHCVNNSLVPVNLSSGTCGLGVYFLSKIKSLNPNNNGRSFQLYLNCISKTLNQLDNRLPEYIKLKPEATLFTIWNGMSGIFLYLKNVKHIDSPLYSTKGLVKNSENIISRWLHQSPPCWEMVEAYFVLLLDPDFKHFSINSFIQFTNEIPKTPADFYQAAWHALLLKIIGKKHQLIAAMELSNTLENFVRETVLTQGLKNLFPFNLKQNCVPVGLEGGVCGTCLPLLSMETDNYDWLSLFGVNTDVLNN